MSVFRRGGSWVSKFQLNGKQFWTPGGPWETKRQAQEAERRHRDRLRARVSDESCASFGERWLEEWPRPATSTRRTYAAAIKRFGEQFGSTPIGDVERLSARSWALTVPRGISRVVAIMYEDARNVGLVEHNPFSNLRLPASERRAEITAPALDEYRSLLEATTCPRRLWPRVQGDDSVLRLDRGPRWGAPGPALGGRWRGDDHRARRP